MDRHCICIGVARCGTLCMRSAELLFVHTTLVIQHLDFANFLSSNHQASSWAQGHWLDTRTRRQTDRVWTGASVSVSLSHAFSPLLLQAAAQKVSPRVRAWRSDALPR